MSKTKDKNIDFLVSSLYTSEFSNALLTVNFGQKIEDVVETDFSQEEMKNLTVDIMEKISETRNPNLMNLVANTVDFWKKDKTKEWKQSLCNFARTKKDIINIYVGRSEKGNEFIIVMEDSLNDNVLDYNEFSFQLAEKYSDIKDFMVLDKEEFESLSYYFSKLRKIYQRG